MVSKPNVKKDLLPINQFTRPGKKLVSIKGIVIHWTGSPAGTAEGHAKYFHNLSKQDPDDSKWDRYASAHYFVGLHGEVVQLIPDNEMAYHVGAKEYIQGALNKFNTTYPNNCLIGVEMCHPTEDGHFTDETYATTVQLVAHMLEKYDLTVSDVVRHHDVTGKICPKWFVSYYHLWEEFKRDISKILTESS